MVKSVCCQSQTRIGYFNISERPDIYSKITDDMVLHAVMGTYCLKCEKLCDFIIDDIEYYTNGIRKIKII